MKKITLEDLNKQLLYMGGLRYGKTLVYQGLNELREYKKIEQELGIDLLAYFKLLALKENKEPLYVKHNHKSGIFTVVISDIDTTTKSFWVFNAVIGSCCHRFKDCGKTWALTKEELL